MTWMINDMLENLPYDILPHDILTRSTRDRMIDLLEIGNSFPLTDLNVVADQLKVAFEGSAKIPIENAQLGVSYELCDPDGKSLDPVIKGEINDENNDENKEENENKGKTLIIESPPVLEDVTYRIRATKQFPDGAIPAQVAYYLDETAPVKVGIDTSLVIRFDEQQQLPLLDTSRLNSLPSDPRVATYNASIKIQVEKTQEGVDYTLKIDNKEAGESVAGDLGNIVLTTGPMTDDAVFQVAVRKSGFTGEDPSTEPKYLEAKLYLKVRANPALDISVQPQPIIGFGQGTTIYITNPQINIKYQAYRRSIEDTDFVRGDVVDNDVVKVAVTDNDVQVQKPERLEIWKTPDGYAPLGNEPVAGSGSKIEIPLNTLTEDTLVIVRAQKEHLVDVGNPESVTIPSSVRLDQAGLVLVQPDPARTLSLHAVANSTTGESLMQVSGGEPGVFYYFKPLPTGSEFPLPAYFHKHDLRDTTQNKGVGQLGVEIDLVVIDNPSTPGSDPARHFPASPVIGISPSTVGSQFSVRAVKAQTRVEVKMTENVLITADFDSGVPLDDTPIDPDTDGA